MVANSSKPLRSSVSEMLTKSILVYFVEILRKPYFKKRNEIIVLLLLIFLLSIVIENSLLINFVFLLIFQMHVQIQLEWITKP